MLERLPILIITIAIIITLGCVFNASRDDATQCDKNGWFTSDGKLYRCEQIKAINDAPVEHGGKVNVN